MARSNVSEKAEFDEISFARHSIPSAQAAAIVAFPTATPEFISASFMSPAENLSRVIFRSRLHRVQNRAFAADSQKYAHRFLRFFQSFQQLVLRGGVHFVRVIYKVQFVVALKRFRLGVFDKGGDVFDLDFLPSSLMNFTSA